MTFAFRNSRFSSHVAWLILGVWIVLSALFMWRGFYSDYRLFISDSSRLKVEKIPEFGPQSEMTFLHFIDTDCACSRFSLPHIDEVEAAYPSIRHVRVTRDNVASIEREFSTLDWAIASPAVAVVSQEGLLNYYGPYTDSEICGKGDSLVEIVVQSLESNKRFQWMNVLAYGCFCDWPVPLVS